MKGQRREKRGGRNIKGRGYKNKRLKYGLKNNGVYRIIKEIARNREELRHR